MKGGEMESTIVVEDDGQRDETTAAQDVQKNRDKARGRERG